MSNYEPRPHYPYRKSYIPSHAILRKHGSYGYDDNEYKSYKNYNRYQDGDDYDKAKPSYKTTYDNNYGYGMNLYQADNQPSYSKYNSYGTKYADAYGYGADNYDNDYLTAQKL